MPELRSQSEEDQDRVLLQASAVVAHKVSKEAARQMVKRAELKITLRELLIFLVMALALAGTSIYFLHQHGQDVSKLNARRAANSDRINNLQDQLSEQGEEVKALQVLVAQLRNSLLALGVAPNAIPSVPPPRRTPSATPSGSPSGSASAGAQARAGSTGNTDARPSFVRSAPSPSASPSSTSVPTGAPSQPFVVVSLPSPLPPLTIRPRR